MESILASICKTKIVLKACPPDICSSQWFLCVQLVRVETIYCFKLVSANSVICYYMNERSHLKKYIRKFLQKKKIESRSP